MRRTPDLGSKILVTFFLLMGFSLSGYWLTQITGDFLSAGFSNAESEGIPISHVIADFATAILSIISAFLILGRNPFGYRLALFACGMLLYTGLSSIGWGWYHDPGLLILFVICAIGALFGFFYIIGRGEV